jgi:hypothetical protein
MNLLLTSIVLQGKHERIEFISSRTQLDCMGIHYLAKESEFPTGYEKKYR